MSERCGGSGFISPTYDHDYPAGSYPCPGCHNCQPDPEGEGSERGCLICGADHPRGAPHQPGEVTRLRRRAEAAEARGDAYLGEVKRLEAEVQRLREALETAWKLCDSNDTAAALIGVESILRAALSPKEDEDIPDSVERAFLSPEEDE